jgi:uncharacterized protein YmfQ (DUF2313 family)
MHCLVVGNPLVERIRVFHRAVFHAGGASGAFFFNNISGAGFQGDLKVPFLAFDGFHFRECEYFDVGMPADLDQFG